MSKYPNMSNRDAIITVSSMDVEDTSGSKLVDIPKLYSFEVKLNFKPCHAE